jgi:hypothetical protein
MAPILFSSPYTRHTYFNGKSPSQISSVTSQFFNTARHTGSEADTPRAFLFGESKRMGYAPRVLARTSVMTRKETSMKSTSSLVLAAVVALSTASLAQDAAHAVNKAAKKTGHTTKVAAKKTAHTSKVAAKKTADGTEQAADKTATGTKHVAKTTGHGVKKGTTAVGNGAKKTAKKTEAAVK